VHPRRGSIPTLFLLAVLLSMGRTAAHAAPGWVWPLDGSHAVSRVFDPGPTPYGPGHRGADLPGAPGDPVRAAGDGRVSYAGLLAGRGGVVVEHGALRTTYEPVTAVVRVGLAVAAGQQIATLDAGHEGCPVLACLHWGLRRGEAYLDPVRLVEGGPVRLLPRGADVVSPGARLLVAGVGTDGSARLGDGLGQLAGGGSHGSGAPVALPVPPAGVSGSSADMPGPTPPPGRRPPSEGTGAALSATAVALLVTAAAARRRR